MKKSILGILLALFALTVTTQAKALLLPLTYSSVDGSGTYGTLELTDISGGILVAASYNDDFFAVPPGNTSFGVQEVYLNLIPGSYTGPITFAQVGKQIDGGINPTDIPTPGTWKLRTSGAGLKPDGLGYFTLNATSNGGAPQRIPIATSASGNFTPLFTLTATDLDVEDFLAFSKNNQEGYTRFVAGMHLTGYDVNPAGSYLAATATVPIPGSVWLLGSGLAGLVGISRWRKRK